MASIRLLRFFRQQRQDGGDDHDDDSNGCDEDADADASIDDDVDGDSEEDEKGRRRELGRITEEEKKTRCRKRKGGVRRRGARKWTKSVGCENNESSSPITTRPMFWHISWPSRLSGNWAEVVSERGSSSRPAGGLGGAGEARVGDDAHVRIFQ